MFKTFKQTRVTPRVVAGNEVALLPFFDNTLLLEKFVLHSMFVFDEALDVLKLQDALERLGQRAGRRKLAARLPNIFSSLLSEPSAQPAIVCKAEDLQPIYEGSNCPSKLDDYLYEQSSVVALHIVSFHDATVLTLNWIHAAFDATAKKDILSGYREDALKDLGTNHSSQDALVDRKTSTLGVIRWALSKVTDLFFRSQETWIICVPAGFELVSSPAGPGEERPFVFKGDILTAWVAVSHLSQYPDRTVAIKEAFSARKVLREYLPGDQPYIANCDFFFNVFRAVKDVLERPLSYTAWQIRRAIKEQTTAEQTEAYCALLRSSGQNKLPPFFGDSSSMPKYIQSVQTPYKFTEMFPIIGKDEQGNYWLSGTWTTQNWDIIEQALRQESPLTGCT
ncbi:hypothetical protein BDW75DRAFT_233670 [Aspergillus navahoensis]